jgi:transposase
MANPLSHLSREELEALVAGQARVIGLLEVRIGQLEAAAGSKGGGPPRTSRNSSQPPSRDEKGDRRSGETGRKPRPSRPGVARTLAAEPSATVRLEATSCTHCGADVAGQPQTCRHAYDQVEIPVPMPVVTRIELHGGRCRCCGRRFRAAPPEGMRPGTPFGPNVHAFLWYLHHGHHMSFERLAQTMRELFGLTVSEGAISNAFARMVEPLDALRRAIRAKIAKATVVASDETTTRIDGVSHWQWVFVTEGAVLHEIAPRRAKAVALEVLGGQRPEVWVSDRYAGQQDLAEAHQVCLAHVLRDVRYAIDAGDTAFAPKLCDLLRWTIRIGKRRETLKDTTLAQYHGSAERRLDHLLAAPAAHAEGRRLQRLAKAWRSKLFVFLQDRRVPATNNACEREIRPSVVFRKVTGGFRSTWGAKAHAGYRTLTSNARLAGQTALQAITGLAAEALTKFDRSCAQPTG